MVNGTCFLLLFLSGCSSEHYLVPTRLELREVSEALGTTTQPSREQQLEMDIDTATLGEVHQLGPLRPRSFASSAHVRQSKFHVGATSL